MARTMPLTLSWCASLELSWSNRLGGAPYQKTSELHEKVLSAEGKIEMHDILEKEPTSTGP